MSKTSRLAGLTCLALLVGSASAVGQTIAHWRFETTGFLDDSVGGHTLLPFGSNNANDPYPLPMAGPGSAFPTTVPLTGQANAQAAQFIRTEGDFFSTPNTAAFDQIGINNAFTIEAFVNLASSPGSGTDTNRAIGGQYQTTGNQRGYYLSAEASSSDTMQVFLSNNGTTFTGFNSGMKLDLGDDYYVAVAVDLTQPNPDDRIVFYSQNLTQGDALQIANIPGVPMTNLFNPTANFTIGSVIDGTRLFDGLMDELRISSAQLTQDQLLITQAPSAEIVPEPGSLLLWTLAGLAVVLVGRRRRASRCWTRS